MMPSVRTVAQAAGPDTAGLILVHVGGSISPDYPALLEWCDSTGRWLIEDAAHAAGSRWRDRPAGSLAKAAAFSLYPTKVVTACEGGVITTDDAAMAEEARIYRDQGKPDFASNRYVRLGGSWRLSEVHAVIGRSQLRCLGTFVGQAPYRERYATRSCADPAVAVADGATSNYKCCARLPDGIQAGRVQARLEPARGSLTGEVYVCRCTAGDSFLRRPLPGADDICARMIVCHMETWARTPRCSSRGRSRTCAALLDEPLRT